MFNVLSSPLSPNMHLQSFVVFVVFSRLISRSCFMCLLFFAASSQAQAPQCGALLGELFFLFFKHTINYRQICIGMKYSINYKQAMSKNKSIYNYCNKLFSIYFGQKMRNETSALIRSFTQVLSMSKILFVEVILLKLFLSSSLSFINNICYVL